MKNHIFKMDEFYYDIVEINYRPFVVFSMTENFENGFISIYPLYRESILTAYEDFKEIVNSFTKLN